MKTYTTKHTISYNEVLNLMSQHKNAKGFSWAILSAAGYTKGTKIFENALDYGIYLNTYNLIRAWRMSGTKKRPKNLVYSFHSKGCDILTESGTILVED